MFLVNAARRAKLPGAESLTVLPGTPAPESWAEVARLTGTTPEKLATHVAQSLKLNVADLSAIEPKALRLLPEKLARRYHVIPLRETDRHITVATANRGDLRDRLAGGDRRGARRDVRQAGRRQQRAGSGGRHDGRRVGRCGEDRRQHAARGDRRARRRVGAGGQAHELDLARRHRERRERSA